MIKTIVHPETGATYKLGRRKPASGARKLALHRYLDLSRMPVPPQAVHYSYEAENALAEMYGNDKLGDCVICGMAHLTGVFTGNAGLAPAVFSQSEIDAAYSAIGGYKPGDPSTDNGCDEVTALNHWVTQGLTPEHKILGWISLTPANVRQAIWLFENAFLGIELPDAWVNPAPAATGFVWDVAGDPVPDNGHCVVSPGYNSNGIFVSTWAMVGTMTYAALNKYATTAGGGELYAVITQEILDKATGKCPAGFDLDQLVADFDAIGGKLTA